jgi:hypothetical protein
MREFNKIFCIGFCKSGTWSIHQALIDLGINSTHDDKIVYKLTREQGIEERNKFIKKYQAINTREFEDLEQYFPNSLYIFTYRNPHDVAYSMARHTFFQPTQAEIDPLAYDCEKLYNNANGWTNYEQNVRMVEKYYTQIFNKFFKYRDRFLFLDIVNNPKNAYQLLCDFLKIPLLENTFPHLNKSKFT